MPGWPQKEQEGFGTDLSASFWGVPATSIPSRPWGCTPGAAGGGRGALGPPWAAAARLQGGGLGGARWWPQHLAGLISGSRFPASPFPPCLQIAAPWGGFLMGGTRRGGGLGASCSPEPRQVPLKLLLLPLEVLDVFHLGTAGRQRGAVSTGKGHADPKSPAAPHGGSPALGPSLQLWIPSPVSCLHPMGSPRRAPALGERAPRTFFCCW